jgi:glycosyltransferase involved in cell wall biosynthesis|tara:strand:- start:1859 stop:2806 length:948 start_codon:yes stop_codon:yes gene_type:complete
MNSKVVLSMATYNSGEGHVYESIKSIQEQTFRNFELIIYEDPSKNPLSNKVFTLIQSDSRIIYIKGKERLGSCRSFDFLLKKGLEKNAKYFAWVTDHDLFHKKWLESLIETLQKDRNAIVAYPQKKTIDSFGKEVKQNIFLAKASPSYSNNHKSSIKRLISFAFLRTGAGDIAHGLFNAEILKMSNIGWPVKITPDKLFLLRLMRFGGIVSLNQVLFSRREKEEEIEFTKANRMVERQLKSVFIGKTPKIYLFLNYRFINFFYLLKHEVIFSIKAKQNILISLSIPLLYVFGSLMFLIYHLQGFFQARLKKIGII